MVDVFDPASIKILLVDDTPENLEIAGRILLGEGYDIYLADTGIRALELARQTVFDLILMDIMMPGLDGFAAGRQLLHLPTQQGTPLIYVSARAEIESVSKAFELGAVDYIRKPYNPLELKARVKTHIQIRKLHEQLLAHKQELEKALAYARSLAKTDELTGLLNRREINALMDYEMIRAVRNQHEFSIILADIDFFKVINDTYGHLAGDQVLKEIARLMRENTREQDFIARWGGEEILLLLPETGAGEATELAGRLRRVIADHPFGDSGQCYHLTMTFGIACHHPGMALNDLLNKADQALYEGKGSGRNQVVISSLSCTRSAQ
ncbi:MAG: diguanylate cyclase [Eubacteriales bacterium]|nr:diguanylate cyclase [Eubacteriales bacterium]